MVGLGRFELPTSPLSGVRSNQLSYRPLLMALSPAGYLRAKQRRSHVAQRAIERRWTISLVEGRDAEAAAMMFLQELM